MTTDIGWAGVAGSTVLVGVAVALSFSRKLNLERSIIWASARAVVQLVLVGVALDFVLGRNLAWSWAWVAAMVFFAADTVRRRAPEVPQVDRLALLAFAAAAVVTLAVLFGLRVFPLQPKTLIPLAGMMIGNSMTATVVGARRVLDELRDKRDEVEARLALGISARDAARPYVRAASRPSLRFGCRRR
jgi:putative ABC transport system permease protein